MAGRRRTSVIGALATAILLFPAGVLPAGGSEPPSAGDDRSPAVQEVTINRTEVPFTTAGVRNVNIQLPLASAVLSATAEVTGQPLAQGGLDYPHDPWIDSGADGDVEWRFSGPGYGAMGYQDAWSGLPVINQTLPSGGPVDRTVVLPHATRIEDAGFGLSGYPVPYWGPEDLVSDSRSNSTEDWGTKGIAFDGYLYVTWQSADPAHVDDGGNDSDILVRRWNGVAWEEPVDLSTPHDGRWEGGPSPAIYRGRLVVLWTSADSPSFFANETLVLREFDGTGWGPVVDVLPEASKGINGDPTGIVYHDLLYIFWVTTDPALKTGDDFDVVYRTYDGTSFSLIDTVTDDGSPGALDWSFDAVLFAGSLWVVWQLDHRIDVTSYDGVRWTPAEELSENGETPAKNLPSIAIWDDPVLGRESLVVIWSQGHSKPGEPDPDESIIVRRHDGTRWLPPEVLTGPPPAANQYQRLIAFGGLLYAIWETGVDLVVVGENDSLLVYKGLGNIVIRSFNGVSWSPILELTPEGVRDDASHPALFIYDGKLYASWETPRPDATSPYWEAVVRNIDVSALTLEVDVGADGQPEWGPSRVTAPVRPGLAKGLGAWLSSARSVTDAYGNPMVAAPLRIKSRFPAHVDAQDLGIRYDYTARIGNLSDGLNARIALAGGGTSTGEAGNISIPIQVGSASPGLVVVKNLHVRYIVNRAPAWPDIPTLEIDEDGGIPDLLHLDGVATDDWDQGYLLFREIGEDAPAHAHGFLTGDRGQVLGAVAATQDWFGTGRIRLEACDSFGRCTLSPWINLTVRPVNDPPVIHPLPDQRMNVGETAKLQAVTEDVDGDPLTFSVDSKRVTVDPVTGVIGVTGDRAGSFVVTVTATDGRANASTSFKVLVLQPQEITVVSPFSLAMLIIVLVVVAAGIEISRRRLLRPHQR